MPALRDWTKFKGVVRIGDSQLSNEIETNLKNFLDWSFLGIGGFLDVNIPQSGGYGGSFHQLRLVQDEEYDNGQVWEGFRQDWVWESGVEWLDGTGNQPIAVTGVLINGTGMEASHPTYGHHINYPLGRVIFDTAIPTDSVITCSYSYRYVQVYVADNCPWWQTIQQESFRGGSPHFEQLGSGSWSIGGQHRVQLPAIVLEVVPRSKGLGKELGSGELIKEQDVLFHVIAEDRFVRNNLCDIIEGQQAKTIFLFNTNQVAANSAYALDSRGMLVGTNMYPDLVSETGYRTTQRCTFMQTQKFEVQSISPQLYEGTVRATLEIR